MLWLFSLYVFIVSPFIYTVNTNNQGINYVESGRCPVTTVFLVAATVVFRTGGVAG